MSKNFALLTLAVPQNLTGGVAAGGDLAPETTYYYRLYATRFDGGVGLTYSPQTPTFSLATTATERIINLSWDAVPGLVPGYRTGYIILRNTSDSFPDHLATCLVNPRDGVLQTNSFSDNGSAAPLQTAMFPLGLPTLLAWGGDTGDPITFWDLYQIDLGNGWGLITPAINPARVIFDSYKKEGMTWISHANLLFGKDTGWQNQTTYFTHAGQGGLIIYGGIHFWESCTHTWGAPANSGDNLSAYMGRMPTVLTYGPSMLDGCAFKGVAKLYGLRLIQGGWLFWPGGYYSWNQPHTVPGVNALPNSQILDCDFGFKGNGYDLVGSVNPKRCRYGGIRAHPGVNLDRPLITTDEGLGLRHESGTTVTEPTVVYGGWDIIWRTDLTHTIIDGVFKSHNQADNRPWIFLGFGLSLGGSLTFKYTVRLKITDLANNPISGVLAMVKDAAGQTVFSGATGVDGVVDAGALLARVLTPDPSLNGVWALDQAPEDDLVTQGKLLRTMHTPHTLTLSKTGLQTYRSTIDLDSPKSLVLGLWDGGGFMAG
ncbi:MAG: hypothetical protein M1438_09565 [Deltaproteobacteria bacterium]|nr:hypothetical protein [Deltaproteobacteria bacterium]